MSTSFLYEEWSNGKLVDRQTDGFADYLHLFAILGAVTLVVIVRLSIRLIRKLICKTRVNGYEWLEARATRAKRDRFDFLLSKVPDVEPEDRDRL